MINGFSRIDLNLFNFRSIIVISVLNKGDNVISLPKIKIIVTAKFRDLNSFARFTTTLSEPPDLKFGKISTILKINS